MIKGQVAIVGVVALCAPFASAFQTPYQTISGNTPWFADSLAPLADLDGDGLREIIVGVPADAPDHNVRVYSSRTGTPLLHINGPPIAGYFGDAVASVGDVDGDGHDDLVVGAPEVWQAPAGFVPKVRLYSSASGALLASFAGPVDSMFGSCVTNVGDLNGDGLSEFAVGAPGYEPPMSLGFNHGAVYVYSGGPNPALLYQIVGNDRDLLGRTIASLADNDGDGVRDLIIGGINVAGLYSGVSGAQIIELPIPAYPAPAPYPQPVQFGSSATALGDIDNDGVEDFAIAARGDGVVPAPGCVAVYSGRTRSVVRMHVDPLPFTWFGSSVAAADVDADGVKDVIVGAPYAESGRGAVEVFSGRTGALLQSLESTAANGHFGETVLGLDDVNGDGADEFAVAKPDLLVELYRGVECGPRANFCTPGTTFAGCTVSLSSSGQPSASSESVFTLTVSGMKPAVKTRVVFSLSSGTPRPYGTSTFCLSGPIQRSAVMLSGGGFVNGCNNFASFDWNQFLATHPNALGQASFAGRAVFAQGWVQDQYSGPGATLTDALSFIPCP